MFTKQKQKNCVPSILVKGSQRWFIMMQRTASSLISWEMGTWEMGTLMVCQEERKDESSEGPQDVHGSSLVHERVSDLCLPNWDWRLKSATCWEHTKRKNMKKSIEVCKNTDWTDQILFTDGGWNVGTWDQRKPRWVNSKVWIQEQQISQELSWLYFVLFSSFDQDLESRFLLLQG